MLPWPGPTENQLAWSQGHGVTWPVNTTYRPYRPIAVVPSARGQIPQVRKCSIDLEAVNNVDVRGLPFDQIDLDITYKR